MYPYLYPNYYSQQAEPPTGVGNAAGGSTNSPAQMPQTSQIPAGDFEQQPGPPVTTNIEYTQGYLRSQIGKRVRIEFLIGTNLLTDRIGTLVDVGISYVIIRLQESDDLMLGDIYSIKFVTFFQ